MTKPLTSEAHRVLCAPQDESDQVSFKLREAVHTLIGSAQALMETSPSQQDREYLEAITKCSEEVFHLVTPMLSRSKNRDESRLTQFDLRAEVESISRVMWRTADRKGLMLKVEINPEVPARLVGDPARTRQVLLNFLDNALKFTHSGVVAVGVSLRERLSSSSALVRLEVMDTGIGIDPEISGRIHGCFQNRDPGSDAEYSDMGLGLIVSKRVVRMMNGEIGFVSKPGFGSTFWFTIPVMIPAARCKEGGVRAGLCRRAQSALYWHAQQKAQPPPFNAAT